MSAPEVASSATSTPPPVPSRAVMAWRLADYFWLVYRRTFRGTLVTSFVTPLLYLVAMGVLLGGFIAGDPDKLEGAGSYLAFVVPGLLAAQVMQTAIFETTYPVMGMVKWSKTFYAMQATPARSSDMAAAYLGFVLARCLVVSVVFLVVVAPFDVVESWAGAVLSLPALVLLAAAFAFPVFAWSAGLENEIGFNVLFRLVMIPLFLFSGAFFPVSQLPDALEWLALVTPLWHGVDLVRGLLLGTATAGAALVHVVVLLAYAAVGALWAPRRLTERLVR